MSLLDSLHLSAETRAAIADECTAIQHNNRHVLKLKIENGQHLLRLKALINHGDWLRWLVEESGLGYVHLRTAEREMALAERLADHLDDLDDSLVNVTALYELTRKHAPADALETALHLLEQGQKIDPARARQLTEISEISEALGTAVRAGELTIGEAHAVAVKLEEIEAPAAVIEAVVTHGVRSVSVVDALMVMHQQQPEQFKAIAASGSIWNPVSEIEVPLHEASRGDALNALDTEATEREARRQQHIRDYATGKQPRVGMAVGRRGEIALRLVELIPDAERQYRVIVYLVIEQEPISS